MRDNCVLKFSVKVNLKRLGGFLKLEIVYLHAHMYMCIHLTYMQLLLQILLCLINDKFLINFGFRLKHLVYVFIFVTSISNLFPITSKVMAL